MEEQKKPRKAPQRKAPSAPKAAENKYQPQVKIRPTIGASRVGQPNAQRVTGARVNSVRVKHN